MQQKIEILRDSPLFCSLVPDELQMLSELAQRRRFTSGEVFFSEGEVGDALYVLVEGTVSVCMNDSQGKEHSIANLKAPEYFGEMSLIDKETRSATVRATDDGMALVLTLENFQLFSRLFKNGFTLIVINIARVLSLRLREANRRLVEGSP